MWFRIPSPVLPCCFSHSWECSIRGFFFSRGSSLWFFMLPWRAVQSDLAYKTAARSVQLPETFRWRFCHRVQGQGSRALGRESLPRAETPFHLQRGEAVGGICGIGNKLCWLLAGCQSRAAVPGSRSLPERHCACRRKCSAGLSVESKPTGCPCLAETIACLWFWSMWCHEGVGF